MCTTVENKVIYNFKRSVCLCTVNAFSARFYVNHLVDFGLPSFLARKVTPCYSMKTTCTFCYRPNSAKQGWGVRNVCCHYC